MVTTGVRAPERTSPVLPRPRRPVDDVVTVAPEPTTSRPFEAVRAARAHRLRPAVVLLLPLLLLLAVFVTPAESQAAASSDVVVVLAGERERLPVALDLVAQGGQPLLVSIGPGPGNAAARRLCADPGDLPVLCFEPHPMTTQGEARAVGRLVQQHGWRSVTVVSSSYHLPRARVLVERCTDAAVEVQAARPEASLPTWVQYIGHELGGLAKAAVQHGC